MPLIPVFKRQRRADLVMSSQGDDMARISYVNLKHGTVGYLLVTTLDPLLTDCSTQLLNPTSPSS